MDFKKFNEIADKFFAEDNDFNADKNAVLDMLEELGIEFELIEEDETLEEQDEPESICRFSEDDFDLSTESGRENAMAVVNICKDRIAAITELITEAEAVAMNEELEKREQRKNLVLDWIKLETIEADSIDYTYMKKVCTVFAGMCIMNDVMVDTLECDVMVEELYEAMKERDGQIPSYTAFYNMIVSQIV